MMELSDKVLIQWWKYIKYQYYMYLDNVSDCYLTPNENLFNYIMATTSYISMFIKMISALYLSQQAKLEFHSASTLKQLSMRKFLFTQTLSCFRDNYFLLLLLKLRT